MSRSRHSAQRLFWWSLTAVLLWGAPEAVGQSTDPGRFAERLVRAAIERTNHEVRYDGRYMKIQYPGGDVPNNMGVCTDLVIRSYRAVGIDLQVEVHQDMSRKFSLYPRLWGLAEPDPNIDHRRVQNLQVFFRRHGKEMPVTEDAGDYLPGDLVTWLLPKGGSHIGIVTDRRADSGDRPLIVHNLRAGPVVDDILFAFPITGHYRYRGALE